MPQDATLQFLTEDARLACGHAFPVSRVALSPSQSFVTVAGRRVLVGNDPAGRTVSGCPNIVIPLRPCTRTISVRAGQSRFITVGGEPVCLVTVVGLTDGTPSGKSGLPEYRVHLPGQSLVCTNA